MCVANVHTLPTRTHPALFLLFWSSILAAFHCYFVTAPYRTGARAVADLIFPVFDVIDRMYPSLIHMGWIKSFLLVPPAFFQDQFYASHFTRQKRSWFFSTPSPLIIRGDLTSWSSPSRVAGAGVASRPLLSGPQRSS